MSPTRKSARPPAQWMRALELRAPFEFGAMALSTPLLRRLPRGDAHHVLVLPGFTADDRSTAPLRALLRHLGYHTHGWRLGQNLGPTERIVAGLAARFEAVAADGPVSVIGWSLGGIYARSLAHRAPDAVRQVVTLGSPIRIQDGDRTASSPLYDSLKARHVEARGMPPGSTLTPLAVPSTSIYSRTDGVVSWWLCLEDDGPHTENVEVRGSHSGLGANPAAVVAIADRLAQPAGDWSPFEPPRALKGLYPDPAVWSPSLA